MMSHSQSDWPVAELDPVRRLRVMAAARSGALLSERVIPAPPERVWAIAGDLEAVMPRLVVDFRRVRITGREGERLTMVAQGFLGQRARFDVVLRPGWCWMQSRFLVGGLAATPHPEGILFGFLGGVRVPGAALVQPLLDHVLAPMLRRHGGALARLEEDVRAAG